MSQQKSIINDIKFGLLSDYEIYWLKERLEAEKQKRKEKPEEYIEAIRCDDGSEGFYVKVEDFERIPAEDLKEYIRQTLIDHDGEIGFSKDNFEKEEYAQSCARYEWQFDEECEEDEDLDEEEEDNDDINDFKNK
jgi:hypothetical protein